MLQNFEMKLKHIYKKTRSCLFSQFQNKNFVLFLYFISMEGSGKNSNRPKYFVLQDASKYWQQ